MRATTKNAKDVKGVPVEWGDSGMFQGHPRAVRIGLAWQPPPELSSCPKWAKAHFPGGESQSTCKIGGTSLPRKPESKKVRAPRKQPVQRIREFARTWLRRELTPADGVSVPAGLQLPAALREMYQAIGAIPALTRAHNRLRAPRDIEVVGEYHIFYDENQQVVRWAFRTADAEVDNPMVWQGAPREDGYDWHSEDMPIGDWIRVMTLWQLVNGGYEFGAYVGEIPNPTLAVEAHFPYVGGHRDGSTRFFGVPGQIICLAGPAEATSVWAAGATPDDLETLSGKLGFEWDYSSADE